MGLCGFSQPDIAVNSAAGIPAAGNAFVPHANGNHIIRAGLDVRGQVVIDAGVAVRMDSKVLSVDPDIAVHVNSAEENFKPLARVGRIHLEVFAVPAGAADCKSAVRSADGRATERADCFGGISFFPLRSDKSASPFVVVNADSDQIRARFQQPGRDGVAAGFREGRGAVTLRLVFRHDAGIADLLAVHIEFVAVVDTAEIENDVFAGHFLRNGNFPTEPVIRSRLGCRDWRRKRESAPF